jgi:septal ring factor EnvC (AmiA/AmiB activator)
MRASDTVRTCADALTVAEIRLRELDDEIAELRAKEKERSSLDQQVKKLRTKLSGILRALEKAAVDRALANQRRAEAPDLPFIDDGANSLREQIHTTIEQSEQMVWSPKDVLAVLSVDGNGSRSGKRFADRVRQTMHRMCKEGELESAGHGKYRLPSFDLDE